MDQNLGIQSNTDELPQPNLPRPTALQGDLASIVEHRRKKRREKEISFALYALDSLSNSVQERLLKIHLTGGWGKFTHGMACHFKAPGRYGHKLVDIALLTTVYDHSVAQVNPVMFASLTVEEFEEETGMDGANIRKALKGLVKKGALMRIDATPRLIFWALNPHYFVERKVSEQFRGDFTQGNSTQVTAPCDKKVDSPCDMTGQSNPGESYLNGENKKEISDAKNLLKESEKESSLGNGDFPKDMLERWSRLRKSGSVSKEKKEREIFQELFLKYQKPFFEYCGRVVEFLEKEGKGGKKSSDGAIHCPMLWIQDHWDSNLARYHNHLAKREKLSEAHADRIEKDMKEQARVAEEARLKAISEKEKADYAARMNAAADRFLSSYPSPEKIAAFAEEAMRVSPISYVQDGWKRFGWGSNTARTHVLEHFLKVESGERLTSVKPFSEVVSA